MLLTSHIAMLGKTVGANAGRGVNDQLAREVMLSVRFSVPLLNVRRERASPAHTNKYLGQG